MLTPTLRRNGSRMVTVRVTHHLTRDDMVNVIAEQLHWQLLGEDRLPSKAACEEELRDAVRDRGGESIAYASERIEDPDEALAWAETVVKHHWPDW